jgi:hypothetical protein
VSLLHSDPLPAHHQFSALLVGQGNRSDGAVDNAKITDLAVLRVFDDRRVVFIVESDDIDWTGLNTSLAADTAIYYFYRHIFETKDCLSIMGRLKSASTFVKSYKFSENIDPSR